MAKNIINLWLDGELPPNGSCLDVDASKEAEKKGWKDEKASKIFHNSKWLERAKVPRG
jgi:hypothetical protein